MQYQLVGRSNCEGMSKNMRAEDIRVAFKVKVEFDSHSSNCHLSISFWFPSLRLICDSFRIRKKFRTWMYWSSLNSQVPLAILQQEFFLEIWVQTDVKKCKLRILMKHFEDWWHLEKLQRSLELRPDQCLHHFQKLIIDSVKPCLSLQERFLKDTFRLYWKRPYLLVFVLAKRLRKFLFVFIFKNVVFNSNWHRVKDSIVLKDTSIFQADRLHKSGTFKKSALSKCASEKRTFIYYFYA